MSLPFALLAVFTNVVPTLTAATTTGGGGLRRQNMAIPEITKFRLIDTRTNKIVLDPLSDGSVYYADAPPSSIELAVEVVVDGSVGSVRIDDRTENQVPYASCGDKNGKFYPCSDFKELGAHSVSATAYERSGAQGKRSESHSITFTIAEEITPSPMGSPSSSPTLSPTRSPVSITDVPTEMTVSSPTMAPMSPRQCPIGEYFDGLQQNKCRKACTFRRGCADLTGGGMFPDYFNDDFLCADTDQGNQCAAKVDNEQCGGCESREQCVQTTSGTFQCACQYMFGRQEDESCKPVCFDVYPYGSCGKNAMCQNTERGPLCTEVGGSPYCNGSCASNEFCGLYTTESKYWGCLPL